MSIQPCHPVTIPALMVSRIPQLPAFPPNHWSNIPLVFGSIIRKINSNFLPLPNLLFPPGSNTYPPPLNPLPHQDLYIVSWEPEGCYRYQKMFHWEPEGQSRCTMSMVIVPFWFSMEHLWIVIVPFWLSTDDIILSFWCRRCLHCALEGLKSVSPNLKLLRKLDFTPWYSQPQGS